MEFVGQKEQDRWIVEEVFPGRHGGTFLDLAATDGLSHNNTVFLERALGWTGLCVEPNPSYYLDLARNRSCATSNACVDEARGEVDFLPNEGLGGIVADDTDNSPLIRAPLLAESYAAGKVLRLQTTSLEALLDHHSLPAVIDYFSFDVEGAETRILRSFPFYRYRFLAMTIERPTPELNERLFANGYVFVKNLSFDSFYVHESLPALAHLSLQPFEQAPAKDW
jgi:hypothetical protein